MSAALPPAPAGAPESKACAGHRVLNKNWSARSPRHVKSRVKQTAGTRTGTGLAGQEFSKLSLSTLLMLKV